MLRSRSKNPILFDRNVSRQFVTPDGDIELAGSLFLSQIPYYITEVQTMDDVKSQGRWKYNHCTSVKLLGDYRKAIVGDSGTISVAESEIARDSYQLLNIHNSYLIVNSDIYKQSLSYTSMSPTAVYTPLLSGGTIDYIDRVKLHTRELIFADGSLPVEINITYDPFDSGFSIWFLIVDVVQLKGLIKSMFNALGNLAKIGGICHGTSLTAKELADDHLAVSFGLLPLFDDLKNMFRILKIWRKFYDNMDKVAQKHRYWRVRPPHDLSRLFPQVTLNGVVPVEIRPGVSAGIPVRCVITCEEAVHHATASYSYICPEFHGWLSRVSQFIDAFGVIDPAALWDVIPFSFIIDWFYGVGNWLHRNRPRAFPCDVWIQDYCESFKLKTRHDWYGTYYDAESYLSGTFPLRVLAPLGAEYHTTFIRRPFTPPSDKVTLPHVHTEIISLRRALISLSLTAQRLPRG